MTDTQQITAMLSVEQVAELDRIAEKELRSRSNLIAKIISDFLDEYED